jgi:hypothetical protein
MKKNGNIITLGDAQNEESFELSKIFRREYLDVKENPILIKQSILVTNLLFQIILDLKGNMFHTSDSYLYSPDDKKVNQTKLNLWETEFIDNDKNEIKKVYKTSFFLKNRNKKQMTEALEFLKSYKNTTYTFKNSKGKELTTSGGLIKDWYFSDKTGNFEITISLYWADRIVTLESGQWNNLKVDIVKEFTNNKQRFFVLWLMEIKKYKGTVKNFEEILKVYDLKYSDVKELMRGFFAPIKMKLDNKEINSDWFSFNYFLDENNKNNIKFVPYDVKPIKQDKLEPAALEDITKDKDKYLKNIRAYKLKYIKRRHFLSADSVKTIKAYLESDYSLFEVNYKKFLSLIKQEKKTSLDYQDGDFLTKIKEVYSLE